MATDEDQSKTKRQTLMEDDDSDQWLLTDTEKASTHEENTDHQSSQHLKKKQFGRQLSIRSGAHIYEVVEYGPVSADIPLQEFVRQSSFKAIQGDQSRKSDCVVDLPGIHDDDIGDGFHVHKVHVEPLDTVGTCVTVGNPKDKRQKAMSEIAKRGRDFATRKQDRLVEKDGACRIIYTKVSDRSTRLLNDLFTTMLELQWRYHFMLFILAFAISWLVFGLIWWGIAAADIYRYTTVNGTMVDGYVPCIDGVTDFPSSLLFSIETQHTIGYGTRAITTACPVSMTLMMLQSMFGVIMQCILTGIIFAKMARPKRRAQTIIFSSKAVICERDGERVFMFRVADIRRSQILCTNIHVMLTEHHVTKEGELLPITTREMKVTTGNGGDFFFLAWPIAVVHQIDKASPLWDVTEATLLKQTWELIVVLEGVAEVTGASFQVRTSYLPSEILWGQRLQTLLRKTSGGLHEIDYTRFHETTTANMGDVSTREAPTRRKTPQSRFSISEVQKKELINNNNNDKDNYRDSNDNRVNELYV